MLLRSFIHSAPMLIWTWIYIVTTKPDHKILVVGKTRLNVREPPEIEYFNWSVVKVGSCLRRKNSKETLLRQKISFRYVSLNINLQVFLFTSITKIALLMPAFSQVISCLLTLRITYKPKLLKSFKVHMSPLCLEL